MRWTLILVALFPLTCLSQFLGPAKITVLRMEKCGVDGPGVFLNVSINKVNRTHQGINVYIDSPVDFGEGIEINGSFAKWGDGGWKPHVLDLYESDACNFFMKYGTENFVFLLKEYAESTKCPVKKGIYNVKNFVFDGSISVPIMYGDFRVDCILSEKGAILTCVRLFVRSDPRAGPPSLG